MAAEVEMKAIESSSGEKKGGLNFFEKYLYIWIGICIAIGILLSQTVPFISQAIDSLQIGGVSIPIGICLFLMMYPAMLNIKTSEIKKLKNKPLPIILTLISNWVVAPVIGAVLARVFLVDTQLIVAVILLASSPPVK